MKVQKKQLKVQINLKKGQLDDPKNLFRDVSNIGTFGVGDYEAAIGLTDDIDYLMSLIRQGYTHHSNA